MHGSARNVHEPGFGSVAGRAAREVKMTDKPSAMTEADRDVLTCRPCKDGNHAGCAVREGVMLPCYCKTCCHGFPIGRDPPVVK